MLVCEACQSQGEIVTGGVYGFFTLCADCCNNLYTVQEHFYVSREELPDEFKKRTECGGWEKDVHESEEVLSVVKLDDEPVTAGTTFLFFCRKCFLDFIKDTEMVNRLCNLFQEEK
jgi:hypothetical protein